MKAALMATRDGATGNEPHHEWMEREPHRLCLLDAGEAAAYENLTARPFRELLQRAEPNGPVLAIGQSVGGLPVGLILAVACAPGQNAKVEWLCVDQFWRRQGIATALVRRLERACVERQCQSLGLTYYENRPSTPAIDRVLDQCNWDRSDHLVFALVRGKDVDRLLQARWMRGLRIRPGFTLHPWHEVPREEFDRLFVEECERGPGHEEGLVPFPACYERDYSFALRHNSRLIGWVITQRCSAHILNYQSMFVRAEYRRRGYALPMLFETIRRHYMAERHLLPEAGGVWSTRKSNRPMMDFIRNRLGPYLTNMHDVTQAKRQLAAQ